MLHRFILCQLTSKGALHLYFFSDVESQHSQHIAQNPKTAAAIYPECQGWRDIKGLQLRGDARLVESNDRMGFCLGAVSG